jgi:hypothetical protein
MLVLKLIFESIPYRSTNTVLKLKVKWYNIQIRLVVRLGYVAALNLIKCESRNMSSFSSEG